MKEQNIKHMSFTSYLRKLTSGVDKVSLETLSFVSVCKCMWVCEGGGYMVYFILLTFLSLLIKSIFLEKQVGMRNILSPQL